MEKDGCMFPGVRIIRFACVLLLMVPGSAGAHVKWFSRDADCSMQPLTPLQVLGTPGFLSLAGFCFLVMMGVSRQSFQGLPAPIG